MRSMSNQEKFLFFIDETTLINFFAISLYKAVLSYSEDFLHYFSKNDATNEEQEEMQQKGKLFIELLKSEISKRVLSKTFLKKYGKYNKNAKNEHLKNYKFSIKEDQLFEILDKEREIIWDKIIKKLYKMKVIDLFYDPEKDRIIWCFIYTKQEKITKHK